MVEEVQVASSEKTDRASDSSAANRSVGAASSANLVRADTPEDRELTRKQLELGHMEELLADRELTLASRTAQLRAFEIQYGRAVGVHLAELDRIEAEIAEELARNKPSDAQAAENARRFRERFESSSRMAGEATSAASPRQADDSLRALYREVARQVHPDLAGDDASRAIRTKLMADANRAYEAGDETRLRALLREWTSRPESVIGDSVAAQLVRTIRNIDRVRIRLARIDEEIEALTESDAHKLMQQATEVELSGRDLLSEIASRVQRDIASAKQRQRRTQSS